MGVEGGDRKNERGRNKEEREEERRSADDGVETRREKEIY